MNLLVILTMIASAYALGPPVQITSRSWNDAMALAQAAVAKLSPQDRVYLGSGLDWMKTLVCAFPASINVAATWDETLMYNNGRYMGEEVRDKGVNVQLGPVANMMRTPQAGRIWEDGVQSCGVQSALKHFVLNDQEAHRDDGGSKHLVTSNDWDLSAGYINVLGNSGDRQNLTLWNNGDELVKAAASKGSTVVVIHVPGAVDMSAWIDLPNVNAVIMSLMPGQVTGNAIADG
ncbi:glycoside hydrolase superfamily [Chytriomyces sp. MP71]|nr:glycoside hydrolase superfamily [Chytriomyces sp. MP71]